MGSPDPGVSMGPVLADFVVPTGEWRPMQRVEILLVDDTDGGPADETVPFSLDGTAYEIDLSAKNAAELRAVLAPWRDCARKTGGTGRKADSKTPAAGPRRVNLGPSSKVLRAWASSNGYLVPTRGQVPRAVREAYSSAHPE